MAIFQITLLCKSCKAFLDFKVKLREEDEETLIVSVVPCSFCEPKIVRYEEGWKDGVENYIKEVVSNARS